MGEGGRKVKYRTPSCSVPRATAYENHPKVIFGHSHVYACACTPTCTRIIHVYIHVHVTPNFLEFDATLAWTAIYLPGLFRTCHLPPRIEGGIGKWVKNLGCIAPAPTELWIIYACPNVFFGKSDFSFF